VSVSGLEKAPITIAPSEAKVFEAKAGTKLTIPLRLVWRGEYTAGLKLKTFGAGFEKTKELEIPNKATTAEAVLDLAALKTPPGQYTIGFYTTATTLYRYNPDAVEAANAAVKKGDEALAAATAEAKKLADEAAAAPADKKAAADEVAQQGAEQLKTAQAAKAAAEARQKAAALAANPTATSDIVFSEPIRLLVTPADQ
jgi:hypothetical protein